MNPGAQMSVTVLTIGHSNHSIEVFLSLLKRHKVTALADVRSRPRSRLGHFNREPLNHALQTNGIEYVFLGDELGARRVEPDCYCEDVAEYHRIADLPIFRAGLKRVTQGAKRYRVALMCAEKEPLDCHRSILICRHLKATLNIAHILGDGKLEPHEQTEQRLIEMTKVNQELVARKPTANALLDRAYDLRGSQIAYRREPG